MVREPAETEEATKVFIRDVARHLEAKGISQAELARRLEVSPAYVSKLLRGRVNPTVATLARVAKALEATMALGLAPPSEADEAESAGGEEAPGATAGEPHGSTSTLTLRELRAQLSPEVLTELANHARKHPRRPGRPEGSGLIDDDQRLERMADLLAADSGLSERSAAAAIAENDPGHSFKSTQRRLRRKFAGDRKGLLAAARERLRRQGRLQEEAASTRRRSVRPVTRPGGAAIAERRAPMIASEDTRGFLTDLQQRYQIEQEVVDRLRVPYMLEALAQVARPQQELAGVARATNAMADVAILSDPTSPAMRGAASRDQPATAIQGMEASHLAACEAATREIGASRAATSVLGASRAATSVLGASRAATSVLGASRTATSAFTDLEAINRQLDPWGQIDRAVRRMANPWSE